jgi:hypothetical protein
MTHRKDSSPRQTLIARRDFLNPDNKFSSTPLLQFSIPITPFSPAADHPRHGLHPLNPANNTATIENAWDIEG